jgi:hypothetical protein
VGHIVHSGASRMQIVDALFFKIGWAWCSLHKMRVGLVTSNLCVFASGGIYRSHSAFQCVGGVKPHCIFCHAQVGLWRFPEKSSSGHVAPNLFFASDGICGSHSACWCVWSVKLRHTIFCAQFSWCGFQKSVPGLVTSNLYFASDAICGSHSPIQCIKHAKHGRNMFHARLGLV